MTTHTTTLERIAEWITAVDYSEIPERIRQRARYQLANVIAATHAGVDTAAGRAVLNVARKRAIAGPCTALPTGDKMCLEEAITVGSAFSMVLDYDDYLYLGHTGHSAVIGSLAICEQEDLPTRDLVTAQIVANEIGGRLGASAVLGPQNGQAWSFIHAASGAALAAKLYGLTASQTAHALAIALYQPTYTLWPGFMGPGSKALTAAGPTVTGIRAAELAREGMTGALDILEHPRKGFWASFAFAPLPHMLTGFGNAWVTDTITYKGYPGCAYIDTAMDALFTSLSRPSTKLHASHIARIDVEASLLTIEMDNLSSEYAGESDKLSPININFSIPYNIAIGAIAGQLTSVEVNQEFLDANQDAIRSVAEKVHLRHNWGMTLSVIEAFDSVLGESSALAALEPSDYIAVILGYGRQLGGDRQHSIDVSSLVRDHRSALGRRLANRLWRRLRAGKSIPAPNLTDVDFRKFQMVFPARVSVETITGERFSARQDSPFGAPGHARYFETVIDKFHAEVGRRLDGSRATAALALIEQLEETSVSDLMAACV